MTLQRRLDELHALSFSDLESAVDAVRHQNVLDDLLAHPQLSPLSNYLIQEIQLSPAYLEFVFRLLELIGQQKCDPARQSTCLLIQANIFARLKFTPKANDADFTLATLQRVEPALNIKLIRPRCMNDVLALLASTRVAFQLAGLFFGPGVFQHSPPALRYKYAEYYLHAVSALDLSCVSARQAFYLRSDNYAGLSRFCPHFYCEAITGTPEEVAGALKGLAWARRGAAGQYLQGQVDRLLGTATPGLRGRERAGRG